MPVKPATHTETHTQIQTLSHTHTQTHLKANSRVCGQYNTEKSHFRHFRNKKKNIWTKLDMIILGQVQSCVFMQDLQRIHVKKGPK